MSIIEIIKAVDGGIAVAVMLIIGWRLEVRQSEQWDDLLELIDKLTNGKPKRGDPPGDYAGDGS